MPTPTSLHRLFAFAFPLLMGAASVHGASIVSSASDFEPRLRTGGTITQFGPYDPGPSINAASLRVGFQTNFLITSAFFFQLPVLAPGESILSADFLVTELADTATGSVTPTQNADLVALGFTNTNPPLNTATEGESYFYVGEGVDDTAHGRLQIQDNFLVPADFIAPGETPTQKSTDTAGDAALLGYINNLYANQATNGFIPGESNLILRLNPDTTNGSGTNRYTVASADNVTAGATRPTLTLEIVPEPGSAILFSLGALGVAARRRRAS